MRKDTRLWITLPASLSLAFSAAALAPALAQANTESQSETESSWQTESQSESQSSWQTSESSQGSGELAKLAEEESDISEFVKAVEKAGMSDALTGGTNYTIFAPTNDALESDSKIQELMESNDPQDRQELVNLLRAHIVADDVDPEMARTIGKAKTVGGGEVELTGEGEQLQVAGNDVVKSDIQRGNLRVYAIDGVLEASASPAMAGSGTESGTMTSADFDELDQDGDGYLSEEELQGEQSLAAQQDEIDQDQDGRVSRTEFSAFEQGQDMPSSSDPRSSTDPSGTRTQPEERQSDWPTDDDER